MRESDIEKYLVAKVKAQGGEVRKVKWIGRDGAPDRLVMLPKLRGMAPITKDTRITPRVARECFEAGQRKDETIWVELKRPGKAATFPADAHERKQHREHERMRKMGQRVEVIDSIEGVEELLG